MVWIIGLFTICALVWLLAIMMSAESDSERRRRFEVSASGATEGGKQPSSRQAA
ncbi:MAG TPA: hypothetical protein VHF07_04360 [Nitrospiraceae bacterium]|nr:hypothetical protein [Nitrospiraceae bacterium]